MNVTVKSIYSQLLVTAENCLDVSAAVCQDMGSSVVLWGLLFFLLHLYSFVFNVFVLSFIFPVHTLTSAPAPTTHTCPVSLSCLQFLHQSTICPSFTSIISLSLYYMCFMPHLVGLLGSPMSPQVSCWLLLPH